MSATHLLIAHGASVFLSKQELPFNPPVSASLSGGLTEETLY